MAGLLQGKVAIVTGSGRGIGRAEALALAAEGAKLVINDTGVEQDGRGGSREPADQVAAEIVRLGGEAIANYDSVADFAAAKRLVEAALDRYGRLDILINNAGIRRTALFEQFEEEDWDAVIAVNLKGAFNTCRHAVPVMMAQGFGRILNTTSNQWNRPEARSAYAAANGGVVSLTYDLAWELRQHGITVNAIAPLGRGRGSDGGAQWREHLRDRGLLSQERIENFGERAGPEFVPPLVVYLASDLAANVTGCVFRCGVGEITIFSHPTETRSVFRDYRTRGPWTIDELKDLLPRTVLAGDPRAPHIP